MQENNNQEQLIQPEIGQSENEEVLEQQDETTFKLYKYRYFNLVIYILAMLQISLLQNSFSPQASQLQKVYNKETIIYNLTSLIHMIVHVPASFLGNYIIQKYNTKVSNTIGCIFAIIACWIRILINIDFMFAILGQFFVGLSNAFIINAITKVSCNWFYPSQRVFVTGCLSFISAITGMVGILIPGIYFSNYEAQESNYEEGRQLTFNFLILIAYIVTSFCVLNLIFYKDKPKTAPSFSALAKRSDYGKSLKLLAANRTYILICFSFAFLYGSFTDFAVILGQLLNPFGFTKSWETSVVSLTCVLSGIFGTWFFLIILKRTQKYKRILFICIFFCLVSGGLFLLAIGKQYFWIVLFPSASLGFFIIPVVPVLLELANEVCYPVNEGIVSGFIYSVSHITAFGLGSLFSVILDKFKDEKEGSYFCILVFIIIYLITLFLVYFMKQDLKRTKEEILQQQKSQVAKEDLLSQSTGNNNNNNGENNENQQENEGDYINEQSQQQLDQNQNIEQEENNQNNSKENIDDLQENNNLIKSNQENINKSRKNSFGNVLKENNNQFQ